MWSKVNLAFVKALAKPEWLVEVELVAAKA